MSHDPAENHVGDATEKVHKNGQPGSLRSGVWLGPNDLRSGYYWCRLGADDTAPTIVKIDDQQSPDELTLWEFESGEWQSLTAYGPAWQFFPVACPNVQVSHAENKS